MHHGKTKHFGINKHFVGELVENEKFEWSYLATENMPACVLTKSHGIQKHTHFRIFFI